MALPLRPPVAPMLARLAREIPADGPYIYEPKWDGFRCLAFCDGEEIDLRSRNDRPLARYFPEIVDALLRLDAPTAVIDGELLVRVGGRYDFPALLSRLHPATSRVRLLRERAPATYVTFDLLALDADLRDRPYAERRAALERLHATPPVFISPATDDPAVAAQWLDNPVPGHDGVLAKRPDGQYEAGKRVLVKVKRERTADCVVAGFRPFPDTAVISSLLLGLWSGDELVHVGVVTQFALRDRAALLLKLRLYITDLAGHPWEQGFVLEGGSLGRLPGTAGKWTPDMVMDWVPLRPELVCEVTYEHVEGTRFRHPARLKRWRPDRDARSCLLEQIVPTGVP